MSGSLKENDMMSGNSTNGGAQVSVSVTAISAPPFVYPEDDPSLTGANGLVKSIRVLNWLTDYDVNSIE